VRTLARAASGQCLLKDTHKRQALKEAVGASIYHFAQLVVSAYLRTQYDRQALKEAVGASIHLLAQLVVSAY
jgi:hypothetical protein